MKYAARRTWPQKSSTWEMEAEAEDVVKFAERFAGDQQLALDDEFLVIEKEGPDSDIQFFKVASDDPYKVISTEPRIESASAGSASATGGKGRITIGISPFITNVLNMTKAFVFALVFVVGIIWLARQFG